MESKSKLAISVLKANWKAYPSTENETKLKNTPRYSSPNGEETQTMGGFIPLSLISLIFYKIREFNPWKWRKWLSKRTWSLIMICAKDKCFLGSYPCLLDLALLALFLLDFALGSPVSKSFKQQLVRVLGNQISTYDSKKWKWMRW